MVGVGGDCSKSEGLRLRVLVASVDAVGLPVEESTLCFTCVVYKYFIFQVIMQGVWKTFFTMSKYIV